MKFLCAFLCGMCIGQVVVNLVLTHGLTKKQEKWSEQFTQKSLMSVGLQQNLEIRKMRNINSGRFKEKCKFLLSNTHKS